jgi:hypothetical protein
MTDNVYRSLILLCHHHSFVWIGSLVCIPPEGPRNGRLARDSTCLPRGNRNKAITIKMINESTVDHFSIEIHVESASISTSTMKSTAASVSLFLAWILSLYSCSAFVVSHSSRTAIGFRLADAPQTPEAEEPMAPEAATDAAAGAETAAMGAPAETQEEEVEESKEKDELAALKTEIGDLEATLKSLRSSFAWTTDKADDFSKAGFARKVAELESMRRTSQVRL